MTTNSWPTRSATLIPAIKSSRRASRISSGPGVGVGEAVGVEDGVGVYVGVDVGVTDGVSARLVASAAAVAVNCAPTVAVARIDSSNSWAERVAVPVAACSSAAAVVSVRCDPGEGVLSSWAAASFTSGTPPPKSNASNAAASNAAASAKMRRRAPPLRLAPFRWLRCPQRNSLIKSDYTRSTHLSE
ncbi:MAG: hypothetical protein F4Z82_15485 [Caldilineaceae bacterium SB0668_bin_21]|nr:hypothetical protein [Caldilineaceae bacterium SB0668_bin_21]MYC21088.1 hypothetical protein [Caldilineaceae bacterium SB0662_bin_25]